MRWDDFARWIADPWVETGMSALVAIVVMATASRMLSHCCCDTLRLRT